MEHQKPWMDMGGLQTYMIFHKDQNLPHFASINLFHEHKQNLFQDYCAQFIKLAKQKNVFINLSTPTWRGNRDYIEKLGYTVQQMNEYHKRSVEILKKLMKNHEYDKCKIVGMVGPRGDGYIIQKKMTVEQAEQYHNYQINLFKQLNVKDIVVLTLKYKQQAIGIIQACKKNNLKVVISFTVQTDAKLPDGSDYLQTIKQVDQETDKYTDYFMINCSHPDHMRPIFQQSQKLSQKRLRAARVNSSKKSHAELDECTCLDIGDIQELAMKTKELNSMIGGFKQVGGCCGTDIRHVKAIFQAILPSV